MRKRPANVQGRRELLTAVGRYAAMAIMTAGAAGVFAKRRRLIRQGKCIGSGTCAGCEIMALCELPAALSARETTNGGDNAGQ